MDHHRFDQFARAFATSTSRRKAISASLAVVATALLGETSRDLVNAKDKEKKPKKPEGGNDKNKPPKPDKGKGKGSGNGKVSVCHDGKTIDVAQPAVQAHLDHGDTLGVCPAPSTEPAVSQIPSYRVDVDCTYAAGKDVTTCVCSATSASSGAGGRIRSLLVPAAEACGAVVGGDFTQINTPSAGQHQGYRSAGDSPRVTLLFSGHVAVGGTASYWCSTDAGVVPAPGPGFVCLDRQAQADVSATPTPVSDISDSTGAIIVEAYACGSAISTPTTSSGWYDRCQRPDTELTLKLAAGSGTPVAGGLTAKTNTHGRALFSRLPPGRYSLDAANTNWCHAESDHVDPDGSLLVTAGTYCHVWIFLCDAPAGS